MLRVSTLVENFYIVRSSFHGPNLSHRFYSITAQLIWIKKSKDKNSHVLSVHRAALCRRLRRPSRPPSRSSASASPPPRAARRPVRTAPAPPPRRPRVSTRNRPQPWLSRRASAGGCAPWPAHRAASPCLLRPCSGTSQRRPHRPSAPAERLFLDMA